LAEILRILDARLAADPLTLGEVYRKRDGIASSWPFMVPTPLLCGKEFVALGNPTRIFGLGISKRKSGWKRADRNGAGSNCDWWIAARMKLRLGGDLQKIAQDEGAVLWTP